MVTNGLQTFALYSIVPQEGGGDSQIRIGSATSHSDGKGFSITLEALPLGKRLVLREQEEDTIQNTHPHSLAERVESFERAVIEHCLLESGGNISVVLQRLNVPRRTLNEKMARLGIKRRRLAHASKQGLSADPKEECPKV